MKSKTKSNTYPVDKIQSKTKFDTCPAVTNSKPKSNTHPDDKFNKTTHVNNRRRTKNQTSKRGKKNVIYLRKESGRKTQLICRERGTRIKCKIDAKTNKCAYM